MGELDKVQKDFYSKATVWFRENKIQPNSSLTSMLFLLVAFIATVTATYFAFESQTQRDENRSLQREKDTLQMNLDEEKITSSTISIENKNLKSQLMLVNNKTNQYGRKNSTDVKKMSKELRTAKNQADEAKVNANLWLVKSEAAQMKFDNLTYQYQTLNNQYQKSFAALTKIEQRIDAEKKASLIAAITPIWLGKSEYFNQRAVLLLAVSSNEQVKQFVEEQIESVYYEIEGVTLAGGSNKIASSEDKDHQRGFYQMAYVESNENWQDNAMYAYIKLVDENSVRVIKFN